MSKGYWEQEGRNPLIGALVFVFIAGAVYFTVQALTLNLYILVDMWRNQGQITGITGGYFERVKALYGYYQTPIMLIIMGSQFLLFLLPSILFYRKQFNEDWLSAFQLRGFSPLGILLAVGGTLLFLPLAEWLSLIFFRLFPELQELGELSSPLFTASTPGKLLLLLLVIGVTPAICEEILFRGYLQSTLQKRYNDGRVVWISGILFGLYHQNPMGLFTLVAAGVWLGLLAWSFRSLYASMSAHLVYNGTIILMANGKVGQKLLNPQGTFYWPITLVSSLLFLLLVWWIWPKKGEPRQ